MLRILLISLLLANVALAGYQYSQAGAVSSEKAPAVKVPIVSADSAVPTIHLFSELMQDQGLLNDSRQCFTLGPFHSEDDLFELYEQLVDVTLSLKERQTQALVEKGYWVYLPPYPSLLDANKSLLALQSLGYKDIAVMYEGELQNSISLGYFLRQENATRRKNSLESHGYAPKMRIQRDAEDRFWLDYEQLPGSGFIALNMQDRPNDFMQRAMPCASPAIIEEPELTAEISEALTSSGDAEIDLEEPVQPAVEPESQGPQN